VAIDPIEKKPLYHFLPNSKAFLHRDGWGVTLDGPFCPKLENIPTANIDRGRYFLSRGDCKSWQLSIGQIL